MYNINLIHLPESKRACQSVDLAIPLHRPLVRARSRLVASLAHENQVTP